MENENRELAIALPGEWALRKAFGPVLTELGEDLRRLYAVGRDRILAAGYKKIENREDGKKANLRVARDVLFNGAFTDDEICAEYFGGVLAASRSEDGRDDSAIQFVDVIKSLSSRQLRLHYFVYRGLNRILLQSGNDLNVAQGSEIQSKQVYFLQIELANASVNVDTDFTVLFRHGLLSQYKIDIKNIGGKVLGYALAHPTTYGVLLYAAAHNRLDQWRLFPRQDFGIFDDVQPPQYFASTLADLAKCLESTSPDGI